MRRQTLALVMTACLSAIAQAAVAHGVKTKTIEIEHPWTDTKSADGAVLVSMTIKNTGKRDDRLRGAETHIATSVELRRTGPAPRGTQGFEAKGGQHLELWRSGDHLVLHGVARQLDPYQTFPLTLIFERAGRIEVEVLVEDAAAPTPAKHQH